MNLLDKLYRKSRITFAIVWIVAYVVITSSADGISADLGTEKIFTVPVLAAMSMLLWLWVRHAQKKGLFALTAPSVPAARLLFYVPAFVVATKKVYFGFTPQASALECVLWVASMVFVGFLEELIFRGFLFRAMDEQNRTRAIIVTSITFGIGHIVNLFNASGQDLAMTLCQISFAVSVGFMLVMMLLKSGSLWPCIIFHMVNNALSVFEDETVEIALFGSEQAAMLVGVGAGCLIALAYTMYLARALPDVDPSC